MDLMATLCQAPPPRTGRLPGGTSTAPLPSPVEKNVQPLMWCVIFYDHGCWDAELIEFNEFQLYTSAISGDQNKLKVELFLTPSEIFLVRIP